MPPMAGHYQDPQHVLDTVTSSSLNILNKKLLGFLSPHTLPASPLLTYSSDLGPMDSSTSKAMSFLHLPGEIRNQIYQLVLVHCASSHNHGQHTLVPTLLSTCRQIAHEATPVLYTINTFTAHSSLLTSLPYLSPPYKPLFTPGLHTRIRRWRITVRLDCDARFTEEDVTKAFTGCEELEVEAKEAMFRGAGNANLMLFAGVRGVKKAQVVGSVEKEFAEWLEESMEAVIGSPCVEKEGVEVWSKCGRQVDWGVL